MKINLSKIYKYRFKNISRKSKSFVWNEIGKWILKETLNFRNGNKIKSILDPACGDGEFLNSFKNKNINLCGYDLREKSENLIPEIKYINIEFQKVENEIKYDLIWVSNLLEHLASSDEIQNYLYKCKKHLNKNGILVIMGPNIKYCFKDYWDFADHNLPLSHLSAAEHLISSDFQILKIYNKFLPYSFNSYLPSNRILVYLYLRNKLVWKILGKQFLIFCKNKDE